MTNKAQDFEQQLHHEIGQVVFGVEHVVHALAVALIARGHVLLEGAPGLGKTLIGKTLTAAIGGDFKRIQGTADLMPTDIIGVHVFDSQKGEFSFHAGPIFADVVLMDEINRTGPKTQSALLEAMEERQVTIDRESFKLASDFLVVATQNPREFEGTYPLPESQLDRFLISIRMEYPDRESEMRVIRRYDLPGVEFGPSISNAIDKQALIDARSEIGAVHLSDELIAYCLDIAAATRQSELINLGLSTRGALALVRCARIEAALRGGEYVVPDDVKKSAAWVLPHRLVLTPEAELDGIHAADEVKRIIAAVSVTL
ncbi:MAG TPA: MoxR family ATPase [Woeseiaceae bacterium]|nr:MoxR family ATPase [Woeseiaceae bacterium]